MAGPLLNLDDLAGDTAAFDDVEENGLYTSRRATVGERIGAAKLAYNLTVLPPGKAQCPFHAHSAEEEMFLILDGTDELRFGADRFPLRRHDVIACPVGGAEVAHQIVNTGATDLRYLAVSTLADVEICEYPDSGKVSTVAGDGPSRLRGIHRVAAAVDYYDGEDTADRGGPGA